MKVVQILIDGFHPDFTEKELLDFSGVSKEYAGFVKLDSKMPRLKRLNSPYMWGRALAGPDFPKTLAGYNPNHTNLQSAQDQGYTTIDPAEWIWNKLSKKGVHSFSFPYYLIEAIPIENVVDDPTNSLATIYARDYEGTGYRLINNGGDFRLGNTGRVYHAVCDNFDYNYGLTKQEVANMRKAWVEYSAETQGQFDEMIKFVQDKMVPKVVEDLDSNDVIIHEELLKEMILSVLGYKDSYSFIGLVESDAIEHYALPYADVFQRFRTMMNDLVAKINEVLKPDILIIHGDHNMVRSDELQKQYQAEFDLDGTHYHTHKAGYNHFPMYSDHGNRVGGYVFYRDEASKPIVDKLLESDDLVIDRLRSWILNDVFKDKEVLADEVSD